MNEESKMCTVRLKCTRIDAITNSLAEGFPRLIREMKEAGEFSDKTTFKDLCMFAGRHILITETEADD